MNDSAILLVGNYSNRTGYAWNNIYRLFNVISRNMDDLGVHVCLSFAEFEPPVKFIDKGIRFDSFEFDPYNLKINTIYTVAKAIRKYKVKFVYFTDHRSVWWFYLFLRCIGVKKIIVHSRVSVPSPYPAQPEKGFRRFMKSTISRIGWVIPDRIYAVSGFVKNRIVCKDCLQENKIVTIMNGINIDEFSCGHHSGRSDIVHVFVGARASEHKGILFLIHAAKLLLTKYKIANYVIEYAGSGPDLEKFVQEVAHNGLESHFIFLGELSSTRDAVCNADIVVVPSVWGDACPSSVSEALAAGKPLITTTAGGIPEIVGDDANAVMLPPANHHELASALARLIENKDERTALGINARQRAESALDERIYYDTVIKQLTIDLAI